MIICKVIRVTPEWLLSGIENTRDRGNELQWYVIDKDTEIGSVVKAYNEMDQRTRERLLGYLEALRDIK